MLDLHRLRLLKEFAARGTIAATAAAMGYTPSAVSQQLAALEREAGMALLDRTARSAELTDAGLRLAAHAERILAQVEEAEADLSAAAREPSGSSFQETWTTLCATRRKRRPDEGLYAAASAISLERADADHADDHD